MECSLSRFLFGDSQFYTSLKSAHSSVRLMNCMFCYIFCHSVFWDSIIHFIKDIKYQNCFILSRSLFKKSLFIRVDKSKTGNKLWLNLQILNLIINFFCFHFLIAKIYKVLATSDHLKTYLKLNILITNLFEQFLFLPFEPSINY